MTSIDQRIDDIVISGIALKYPGCDSIEIFGDKLYSGQSLIIKGKCGERPQTDSKETLLKQLCETTYQAICDAGVHAFTLRSKSTGVFVGNCFDGLPIEDLKSGVTPSDGQSLASQLSNQLHLRGPAISVDKSCASSLSALNEAVTYMRQKRIDSAIVVSIDSIIDTNGETVVVLLLQQRSAAKRIYVTIIHSKTNSDENENITRGTTPSNKNLMATTYDETDVEPKDVNYIECHFSRTDEANTEELRLICETLCLDDREQPLLIGNLKLNLGQSLVTSGILALSKVIISLEKQSIPENIHLKKVNSNIDGKGAQLLKPVDVNTPFCGDLVALNNYGLDGTQFHLIIKSPKVEPKEHNKEIILDDMPRLVMMCAQNEECLEYFFENLFKTSEKLTRDLLALINETSKIRPIKSGGYSDFNWRGFALIEDDDEEYLTDYLDEFNITEVKQTDRQIWFVMSGMGSQWSPMAKELIQIKVIEKSIKNLCEIMNKYSIDLWELLMNENNDSVLNSFLTIAALQIALIDFLEVLDIKADGIIGHSIGELTCAYADKCLTAEETIVMAYWRGKCIEDNSCTRGSMVTMWSGVEQVKSICPSKVFIACDNSDQSVTVAGDNTAINEFVRSLNAKDEYPSKVQSSGIAFHTPLMHPIGDELTSKLKSVLPDTRQMSGRWISSNSDNKPENISAKYFVDNLLYPIRFNESVKQIPKNAIIIEVSPHSLFQSIIKRSLGPNISYISLMKKNDNNINVLLSGVGTLYTLGLNPSIEELYPKVDYPVSNGTKFISSLVKMG